MQCRIDCILIEEPHKVFLFFINFSLVSSIFIINRFLLLFIPQKATQKLFKKTLQNRENQGQNIIKQDTIYIKINVCV